jgi:hypothetical protein
VQTITRCLHQHRQLGVGVCRSDVLDDPAHATTLLNDLHTGRPRGCLDLPNVPSHPGDTTD